MGHINPQESEENLKEHVMDFLKNTYFSPNLSHRNQRQNRFCYSYKQRCYASSRSIVEAKKSSNHEMVTLGNLNTKAKHEIFDYLRERIEHPCFIFFNQTAIPEK